MSSEATCQTFLNSVVKSAAPAIAQAINKLLTGALSAANITQCLNCTSQKIEDDFDRNKPNCGSGRNNTKKGANGKKGSAPTKGEKAIKQPVNEKPPTSGNDESGFIDYPDKFKEGIQTGLNNDKVTKFGVLFHPHSPESATPGPVAIHA